LVVQILAIAYCNSMKSNKLMNMNNYKPSNNLIIFCFTGLLLLANNSYAVDMGVLQEQCAEIGFKLKTPENGKCVLKLMKSVASQQAKEAAQQKAYEQEQQYKREAEARAIERNNQELARQQIQTQQYQQARQQQEPSYAETLIKVLFVGALGIGQGVSQGLQQQSAPSFQPIIQSAPSSFQPIQNTESFRCRTRMSINGSSANTTCEK